jgi:DNA polymerase elongation subunit (family B)
MVKIDDNFNIDNWLATSPSKEEMLYVKSEIEKLVSHYYNEEQGIKIGILNSLYGAFGNQYFRFFNKNIAETITQQAKTIILYAEEKINDYFKNEWHVDHKLHSELGIRVKYPIKANTVIYIDTDSAFLNMGDIFKSTTGWNKTIEEFIIDIYNKKLIDFFKHIHEDLCIKNNFENFFEFDLEYIGRTAYFQAKKNYCIDITWKNGKFYIPSHNPPYTKGLPTVKGSTPPLVKKQLKEIYYYLLKEGSIINTKEFAKKLKIYKDAFNLAKIEDISMIYKVNNYEQYVINDQSKLEIADGCPFNVRASAVYNYLLNKSNLKGKYEPIQSGDRVRIYVFGKPSDEEYFAYKPGKFPREFAPPINYDLQFFKHVVNPVNSILEVQKMPQINMNLVYRSSLL